MSMSRLCLVLLVAALGACAALEPAPPAPGAAAFDLVGRVAATHDGRAFSSGVRWQHRPAGDEIWLLTPTGQALAHIAADAEGAVLTGADQARYHAADVESLTRRVLGWALPVSRLAWWVRGEIMPAGLIGEVLRDEQGRLLRLRQDGWQVTFTPEAGAAAGAPPRRLEVERDGQRIRLVVDNWR